LFLTNGILNGSITASFRWPGAMYTKTDGEAKCIGQENTGAAMRYTAKVSIQVAGNCSEPISCPLKKKSCFNSAPMVIIKIPCTATHPIWPINTSDSVNLHGLDRKESTIS